MTSATTASLLPSIAQLIDAVVQVLDLLLKPVAEPKDDADCPSHRDAISVNKQEEACNERGNEQGIEGNAGRHLHSVVLMQQATTADPSFI